MFDKLLEKFGLDYEDLSIAEKETLDSWGSALSKNILTVDSVKQYIQRMKSSVENELAKTDLNRKQDMFLKARLRNYLLLESYLETPERARKQLEQALSNINRKVKK